MERFASPRQALAYMYACHKGPGWAQLTLSDAPPGDYHDQWVHVMIGAFVYGPKDEGFCGVLRGGRLDRHLKLWATGHMERTNDVRRVERRLRGLLREHGMKLEHLDVSSIVKTERREDGTIVRYILPDVRQK